MLLVRFARALHDAEERHTKVADGPEAQPRFTEWLLRIVWPALVRA